VEIKCGTLNVTECLAMRKGENGLDLYGDYETMSMRRVMTLLEIPC